MTPTKRIPLPAAICSAVGWALLAGAVVGIVRLFQ